MRKFGNMAEKIAKILFRLEKMMCYVLNNIKFNTYTQTNPAILVEVTFSSSVDAWLTDNIWCRILFTEKNEENFQNIVQSSNSAEFKKIQTLKTKIDNTNT